MRIGTNLAADGGAVPFNNEPSALRTVIVWGTPTNVDLEISPDAGVTWIAVQNFTAAGSAQVPLGGSEGYQVRCGVTAGTGVYMDIL